MPAENRLIELLSRRDRLGLMALGETVELVLSDVLFESGRTTRHVYFPTEGFVSLLAAVDEQSVLEVGMVGSEGMLGVHALLGSLQSPLRAIVQGPGNALRIAIGPFRRQLRTSATLQQGLNRYVAVLMTQLASTAGCMRFHEIGPRLARWLLMSQDRAGSDQFFLTQEFLAFMLGVRRVGVTTAASRLQWQGLIAYHRGEMTIVDRVGLEAMACSCYASDRTAYRTIMQ